MAKMAPRPPQELPKRGQKGFSDTPRTVKNTKKDEKDNCRKNLLPSRRNAYFQGFDMFEIDENSILRLRKFVFLKCFRQDAFKMFQERLQDPSRRPTGAQHGPRSPSKASPRPRPKAGFHGCCWLQAFKTLQERPQDPSRWPKDVLKGLWGELPRVVRGGAGAPPRLIFVPSYP